MGAAAPVVGAGLSFLQGMQSNDAAQHNANSQLDLQRQLINRKTALFDTMKGLADAATARGEFDPSARIARLQDIVSRYDSQDRGNQAGADRVLGYRPGDTESQQHQDALALKWKNAFAHQADQIYNDSLSRQLAAYGAANGGQALDTGIQAAGQQQQLALSQMQNPAGMIGAWLPLIQQMTQRNQNQSQNSGNSFQLPAWLTGGNIFSNGSGGGSTSGGMRDLGYPGGTSGFGG